MHRQTHALCIVGSEDVAEVARGHDDVDCIAHLNLLRIHKVEVRGEIVDDLRQQATPIDRVRTGEHLVVLRKLGLERGIGENFLHAGLCVVKVAVDSAHADVFALLRVHLALLHGADAVFGIEHDHLRARDVLKALERRLAGIAGCCDQYDRRFPIRRLFKRAGQKVRQNLQRHVFKRAGWAVPQL